MRKVRHRTPLCVVKMCIWIAGMGVGKKFAKKASSLKAKTSQFAGILQCQLQLVYSFTTKPIKSQNAIAHWNAIQKIIAGFFCGSPLIVKTINSFKGLTFRVAAQHHKFQLNGGISQWPVKLYAVILIIIIMDLGAAMFIIPVILVWASYISWYCCGVVTAHVKYGDQGITIHGWIINIIIKGSKVAAIDQSHYFTPFLFPLLFLQAAGGGSLLSREQDRKCDY